MEVAFALTVESGGTFGVWTVASRYETPYATLVVYVRFMPQHAGFWGFRQPVVRVPFGKRAVCTH